jgi:hypothetical protein
MTQLSETDKAYLAGIIDGEGCITVCKGAKYDNRVVTVAVVMNDREAVDMLFAAFGGCFFEVKKSNPKWNDSFRWAVKQRKAKIALEAVLPYLRVKDRQARLALEFISSFTHIGGRATVEQRERQCQLHQQISSLNQREESARFSSSTSLLFSSSITPISAFMAAETE